MKTKRIIAILISLMMIFCGTSSIAFAAPVTEDTYDVTEETVAAAETAEGTEEAADTTAVEESATEETAVAEDVIEDIDIVSTNSPVEASKEVPAADNEKYYTIDLNTGEVKGTKQKKIKNGFKKLYGKDFSKAGIKGKSKKEKHKRIEELTEENELYSVESIENNTAEICANYASCRLIIKGIENVETFGAISGVNYRGELILKYTDEEATAKAYESLCEKYGSEHVMVDLPVRIQEDSQGVEWNYSLIGFPSVVEPVETYGRDITVAVIDSGINESHEVFEGETIIKGPAFVEKNYTKESSDDCGHGTCVAGIIAQSTGSNVEILAIKTLDQKGDGSILNALLGVDYAKDEGADIINMSLSGSLGASSQAVDYWLKFYDESLKQFEGPIIVASGNEGKNIESINSWPAISEYTISVGSININLNRSTSSNYGDQLDFTAPGVNINVAEYDTESEYKKRSGTSFAAPHVAAAAAMIMANDSRLLTSEQVREELVNISADLGAEGFDVYYGYGMPDLKDMTINEVAQARWIKKFTVASIPVEKRIYNGNAIEPELTVTRGDKTLVEGTDYTVEYSNNKNVGMAKATITGINDYFGTKEVNFKVAAMGTSIKKLTRGSGTITVKWAKQTGKMSTSRITGYQIQVATNSAFTKNAKKVYKTKYTSTSKKITKLKKKKKYYVRVRTYKTVSGTKFYSKWSPVKTIKTK